MNIVISRSIRPSLAVMLVLVASAVSATEYLSIPAAAMLPRTNGTTYDMNGICLRVPNLTSAEFVAPVELPNGVSIEALTLEAHDAIGGEFGSYVVARLVSARYFSYYLICECTTGVAPAPGDCRIVAPAYNFTIDNTENSYFLYVNVNNTSGTAWESEMFFKAIIRYHLNLTAAPDGDQSSTGQLKNLPNPFNPSTTTAFDLQNDGDVRLNVYDLQGACVRTLVDERMVAGNHRVVWDGRDDKGAAVASGVYLMRLETAAGTQENKVTLVR